MGSLCTVPEPCPRWWWVLPAAILQFRGGALVPGCHGVALPSLGGVLSVASIPSFTSCAVALLLGLFIAL